MPMRALPFAEGYARPLAKSSGGWLSGRDYVAAAAARREVIRLSAKQRTTLV
jgi:hypothetical protein